MGSDAKTIKADCCVSSASNRFRISLVILESFLRFSDISDDRFRDGIVTPCNSHHAEFPAGYHVLVGDAPQPELPLGSGWGRTKIFLQRLEDSWLGDCIAAVGLMTSICVMFVFLGVIL